MSFEKNKNIGYLLRNNNKQFTHLGRQDMASLQQANVVI